MLICVINKKRYSFTKVRDKRSVVRTLNTFINQYEYVFCDSKEIDLNIEPMVLSYKDKKIDIDNKNIVFCKNEAEIDLKNTTLICEAVDSLLSINKKEKLK
ncbi:MAG: hypothetical protein U9N59_05250, partial [Campylobacterota bacterium]|nr:hypothetical protein [Campylobacterota bacterium]